MAMDNAYTIAVVSRQRQQQLARVAATYSARYVPPSPRPRRRRTQVPQQALRRAFRLA